VSSRGPTPIAAAIASALHSLGLGKKLRQYDVLELWASVVGEQIAAVTTAERIEDGKLFVSVRRAPWRNELVFLKAALIVKLNAAMGETKIGRAHV
jgi:predicted nucleic acid-binding Zn ribbon protein